MPWDLTIQLPDQPGTFATIAEALATAGINLEAVTATTAGGVGTVHLLVDQPGEARSILEEGGATVLEEREVLVVECPDQPGEVAGRARAIADAGVNIELLYVATRTRVVFGTDDNAKAAAALTEG